MADSHQLHLRNIYIVPSKAGLALLVLIGVLFVLGINFQNALVYAVCCWLIALLLLNVFYTWRNLKDLNISVTDIAPCFAGDKSVVELTITSPEHKPRYAIELSWPEQDQVVVDLPQGLTASVKLSHPALQRGFFRPPRLTIKTLYPTGLGLVWAYMPLVSTGMVYPRPQEVSYAEQGSGGMPSEDTGLDVQGGSSDFGGIREYKPGDSPKHIHWGKYAHTGKFYTKTFVDYTSHDVWLDWYSLNIPGIEKRLSHLCSKVLAFEQAHKQYGLKLPNLTIAPNGGEAHKAQCLRALALYGVNDA